MSSPKNASNNQASNAAKDADKSGMMAKLNALGLVPQILLAIIAGCVIALVAPELAQSLSILG